MCDMVSWIEKDGKNYFVTDDDVEAYNDVHPEDQIDLHDSVGHSAVEKIWKIDGEHMQFPICRNCDRMPEDVFEALANGKMNRFKRIYPDLKISQKDGIQKIFADGHWYISNFNLDFFKGKTVILSGESWDGSDYNEDIRGLEATIIQSKMYNNNPPVIRHKLDKYTGDDWKEWLYFGMKRGKDFTVTFKGMGKDKK